MTEHEGVSIEFPKETNQQQFEAAVAQLARALTIDLYCWWSRSIDMPEKNEEEVLGEAKEMATKAVEHLKLYDNSGTNSVFVARMCVIYLYTAIDSTNRGTSPEDYGEVESQIEKTDLQKYVLKLCDIEMTSGHARFEKGIKPELRKLVFCIALRSLIDGGNENAAMLYQKLLVDQRQFGKALDQRRMVYLLVAGRLATAASMCHEDLYPNHPTHYPDKALAYAEKVMMDICAPV